MLIHFLEYLFTKTIRSNTNYEQIEILNVALQKKIYYFQSFSLDVQLVL